MRHRFALTSLICLGLSLTTQPGLAQTVYQVEDAGDLVHYAYGNLLGTGYYELDDRSVAILRFPIGFKVREPVKDRFGVRLELPVAIGLQNYAFDGVPELDVDNLATVSVLPGVTFSFLVKERWTLDPAVYIGYGRDITNEVSSFIYGGGLSSKYKFDLARTRLTLGTNLLGSGYTPQDGTGRFITRFGLGLDALFPTGMTMGDRNLLIGTFGIAYVYLNELEFRSITDTPITVRDEYEIGVAIAGDPAFKFLGLTFERAGLSYRFSDNTNALILVGSFPF
jgi:hypothetical protein